ALQWLQRTPTPIGQQARWLDVLGEFDFRVLHRPGRAHANADALSRRPCKQCGAEVEAQTEQRLCNVQFAEPDSYSDWDKAKLAKDSENDTELERVYSWLKRGGPPPGWDDVLGLDPVTRMYWKQYDR